MAGADEPIRSPGLIVCEGRDDFAFLLSMLAEIRVPRDVIDVRILDGRWRLHAYLNALPINDSRRRLRAVGIVCDADVELGPVAFARVRDDLRSTGYSVPDAPGQLISGPWGGGPSLSVGVYIMPDNQIPGALEDLCISAIAGDPSLPCVDDFLACVSSTGGVTRRNQDRSKARLNAWLASRSDPTLLLGHAMNANQIDRGHTAFAPIRDFLTRLAAAASAPEPSTE